MPFVPTCNYDIISKLPSSIQQGETAHVARQKKFPVDFLKQLKARPFSEVNTDDNYHTPPFLGEQQINGDLKWTVAKLVLHVMLCEHVKMNRLNHQYLFYCC